MNTPLWRRVLGLTLDVPAEPAVRTLPQPLYRCPILAVPHIVDGDTAWVVRRRHVGDIDGAALWAEDHRGGVPVRLHDGGRGVNTPERAAGPRWNKARDDLTAWVQECDPADLELWVYGRDNFGRLLGDLRDTARPGVTAVQHMVGLGWETYR